MRSFTNFLHAVSWGYHWCHPRSLHPLKMTLQRLLLTKPRCRPAREFAGGGSELWRPRLQTRHFLKAYFSIPFVRHMYDWGVGLEGGGGQGSLRFLWFPSHRPWFGGVFFCDGRSYSRRVYGKYGTMIWGQNSQISFAKRQEKSRVMTNDNMIKISL